MFTDFQTDIGIGGFFGEVGERVRKRTTSEDSESFDKKKHKPNPTKFGTSLYIEKTKIDYNENDEYGMSDSENSDGQSIEYRNIDERGTTTKRIITSTDYSSGEMGENEHREKSPDFGDFFRINEDNIQYRNNRRCTCILSDKCICNNDSSDDEKIILRSVSNIKIFI